MPRGQNGKDDVIVIKKYINRRLYNTASAEFVTLADLHQMVKEGKNFTVRDAKSDTDITTSVLAQIIAEEESRGNNLLPLNYLRQLLSFYNEGLGQYLGAYLDQSMENFAANQQNIMRQVQGMLGGGAGAVQQLNEFGRRNMEIFQQSLSMFGAQHGGEGNGNGAAAANPDSKREIESLQKQLADIQRRLNELSAGD